MEQKGDKDILLDYLPSFKKWHVSALVYLSQLLLFISIIVSFYLISSYVLVGALIFQTIISFLGVLPYRYMSKNSEKIQKKYLKKYGNLAIQSLWFHYESYTVPLLSSSLYFPLILVNYDFIPSIINSQSDFLVNSLLPFYVSIPISLFIIFFAIKIRKPSGGFDAIVESYIYLIYPKKGKLIADGIYRYIRHPRYLGRTLIALGLAIIANNILAILVAGIHSFAFLSLIPSEDNELARRFGDDFRSYKERVPALIPRYGNWRKFVRYVFYSDKGV